MIPSKIKTRLAGDFNAPWFFAIYQKVSKGFYSILLPNGEIEHLIPVPHTKAKYCSLRKTVTKNFNKWKYRKKMLNKSLKEKKISLWQEYWWAKYWRKGKTLRVLALELAKMENLPEYEISNKERSKQIIDALDQSEKYHYKFDILFAHVDPMFAYRIETFKDFLKDYSKKEQKTYKDIPRRFIQYFK